MTPYQIISFNEGYNQYYICLKYVLKNWLVSSVHMLDKVSYLWLKNHTINRPNIMACSRNLFPQTIN
jgi:hypothetical protein